MKYITLHSSATYPSMDHVDVEWIRRIHVDQNGWSDIGYAHVIKRDGTVEAGRPEHITGAHVGGNNTGNLGVCLVGGLREGTEVPQDNYTLEQWQSLNKLMKGLLEKYPEAEVMGHNGFPKYTSRGCPCFDWRAYRDWLLSALSSEHLPSDWWGQDWHVFPDEAFHEPLDFYRETVKLLDEDYVRKW